LQGGTCTQHVSKVVVTVREVALPAGVSVLREASTSGHATATWNGDKKGRHVGGGPPLLLRDSNAVTSP
jgi:hypothetical protein